VRIKQINRLVGFWKLPSSGDGERDRKKKKDMVSKQVEI